MKVAGYEINQMNLLTELHENRIANPFLVSSGSISSKDTDLQGMGSKVDISGSLGYKFTSKLSFVPNCFHCLLQDQIVCLLPSIQGFKHNVAISGLIHTVLEPFSISNNDKCFVFKVKVILLQSFW